MNVLQRPGNGSADTLRPRRRLRVAERSRAIAEQIGRVPAQDRPRATWWQNAVTIVLGGWTTVGGYLDVWSHKNTSGPESFFSPWHALFYSGVAATAVWIAWIIRKNRKNAGGRLAAAIPVGYGLAVIGILIVGVGGVGDMAWHTIFGVDVKFEAFVSPPHLWVMTGYWLIMTSPFRAEWSSTESPRAPRFIPFLPVLLSVALGVAAASMFIPYLSPVIGDGPTDAYIGAVSGLTDEFDLVQAVATIEIASVLVTNLLLVGAVLVLLKRWQPPFGSITLLFGFLAALVGVLEEYPLGVKMIFSAIGAGLIADVLILRLRPSTERRTAFLAVGGLIPLTFWSTHFLVLELTEGLGWPVEFSTGATMWTILSGLVLAALMLPQHSEDIAAGSDVPGRARRSASDGTALERTD